ncbi:hypothetical protein COT49_01640 [candidate division WWE3 bacterium CG08_land_8_20_14_0_20_40_13]|uniref:Uncharacterized protein n=1 Tax=candidate division WWE3 bacterium CG08_land_8_20_14_0_20_40_13 TaxID=1975084 RepID=A0A2H0XDZ5_UNCKA|nr:MAG: hypothetical protein COT49_01640 [candidate division WWE3 bacterium CG08_land_8_20_14_0_20_40_13]
MKFAANFNVDPIGGVLRGSQGVESAANTATNIDKFVDTISVVLFAVGVVSGLILLGMLITGGIMYMSSQGDEKQLNRAKKQITDALVGFVIVIMSWWAIRILEKIFGIDLLIPKFFGI